MEVSDIGYGSGGYADGDTRIPVVMGRVQKRKLPSFKKWRKKKKKKRKSRKRGERN